MGSFTRNVAQEMAGEAGFNGEGKPGWMSLGSEMEVDEWLYSNQNATPVAVIFKSDGIGGNDVSYTLQYNHTRICNVISALDCTDPKHDIMASFQRLVDQSVLRVKRFQEKDGRRDASIDVKFSDFPHPAGVLEWDVMEGIRGGLAVHCGHFQHGHTNVLHCYGEGEETSRRNVADGNDAIRVLDVVVH